MQVTGSVTFKAQPERVYETLTNKDALARATPGIQSLEQVAENKFEAVMKVGVASVSGTYKGSLELVNRQPPRSYTLAVAGEGAPGFVRGTANFDLALNAEGGTTVSYLWDVQVGGLVAGVGQRVLGGVARVLIGQFMEAMRKELAG